MLQFTDLNHTKHFINISNINNINNINNIVIRNNNGAHIITFYMPNQSAIPVTVDCNTLDRITKELEQICQTKL